MTRRTARRGAAILLPALLICYLGQPALAQSQSDDAAGAVDWLNSQRAWEGFGPVSLDDSLSVGAQAHSQYLALNAGTAATRGLLIHEEDASLPGATPEGAQVAGLSDIAWGSGGPLGEMQRLMSLPLHRQFLLNRALQRVGLGDAVDRVGRHWVDIDVVRGVDFSGTSLAPAAAPAVFPGPDQISVPARYAGNETPDPLQLFPDAGPGPQGYVISVEPTCGPLAPDGSLVLMDDAGADVALWLIQPGTVLSDVGGDRPVNQVLGIPRAALRPGTTYQAEASGTCSGHAYDVTWQFTTA